MRTLPHRDMGNLRTRMVQLREDLSEATKAYRLAAANHDSEKAIPLLRSRSQLMRQLLEAQCELLLSFRSGTSSIPEEVDADQAARVPQNASL